MRLWEALPTTAPTVGPVGTTSRACCSPCCQSVRWMLAGPEQEQLPGRRVKFPQAGFRVLPAAQGAVAELAGCGLRQPRRLAGGANVAWRAFGLVVCFYRPAGIDSDCQ